MKSQVQDRRKKGSVAGWGTMNIWAISSGNLLVPSRSTSPDDAHTDSIWWWTAALHTQLYGFMVKWHLVHDGQLRSMTTWWTTVKCSVSTKAQWQTKSCFSRGNQLSVEDGRTFFQNPKDPCCNSSMETCQWLKIAFVTSTGISNNFGYAGSWSPSGTTACTAA